MMQRRQFVGLLAGASLTSLAGTQHALAQDALVAAARKEGKLVWYTSLALPSAEKMGKLFETTFPGIKVEVNRVGSQRILQRVMQEVGANIKNVDVIHTSDAGHFELLKDKKLLMKHTPAGVDAFPAGFKDREGYYYGLRATVTAIAYNTKGVSAADAPKTWKDLLHPRWKGKLVTAHPGYSGVIATHVDKHNPVRAAARSTPKAPAHTQGRGQRPYLSVPWRSWIGPCSHAAAGLRFLVQSSPRPEVRPCQY